MRTHTFVLVLFSCCFLLTSASVHPSTPPVLKRVSTYPYNASHRYPYFIIHGFRSSARALRAWAENLTAEGYTVTGLKSCDDLISRADIFKQVYLLINEMRAVIAKNPVYENGYHVAGHSLGGLLARSIAELMSDHKIINIFSFAGVQNGVYYDEDDPGDIIAVWFANAPGWIKKIYRATGCLQFSTTRLCSHRIFQMFLAGAQLWHAPFGNYYRKNVYLPFINNINRNESLLRWLPYFRKVYVSPKQRKENFLRIHEAHFFYSMADEVIRPPESAIFGFYEHKPALKEVERILNMTDTEEYIYDLYGLRTLHETKRLFFYHVAGVPHTCWTAHEDTPNCLYSKLWDEHMYPSLTRGQPPLNTSQISKRGTEESQTILLSHAN